MTELSLGRLYTLRATYLLLTLGLGVEIWPGIIHHDQPWGLMQGVVCCVLGAVSILAVLGVKYPVQMLPLLLFEMTWKAIWLVVVALPLWAGHRMDAPTSETAAACLMGAIFPLVIPWPYVMEQYLRRQGDRWT